jgi:hypothetical protein
VSGWVEETRTAYRRVAGSARGTFHNIAVVDIRGAEGGDRRDGVGGEVGRMGAASALYGRDVGRGVLLELQGCVTLVGVDGTITLLRDRRLGGEVVKEHGGVRADGDVAGGRYARKVALVGGAVERVQRGPKGVS